MTERSGDAPRRREGLTAVELDGEAVIFDEVSCELHHLNASATIVWHLCDGTSTGEQMAGEIAEAMELPRDQIEPQVLEVVDTFRVAGLLASADSVR